MGISTTANPSAQVSSGGVPQAEGLDHVAIFGWVAVGHRLVLDHRHWGEPFTSFGMTFFLPRRSSYGSSLSPQILWHVVIGLDDEVAALVPPERLDAVSLQRRRFSLATSP
jgi:hypothetical protein